jgi:hypothetical protein
MGKTSDMRASSRLTAAAILFGAAITPAFLAGPSHAKSSAVKNSDVAKTADEASAPPCYSYEQNADGSWRQTACQESGAPAEQKAAVQRAGKKASR